MFQSRIIAKLGLWMGWCLLFSSGGRAQEKVGPTNESNLPESAFQSAQTFQLAGDYEELLGGAPTSDMPATLTIAIPKTATGP